MFAERGSTYFRVPTDTSGTKELQIFHEKEKNCKNSLPVVTINGRVILTALIEAKVALRFGREKSF